MRQVHAEQGRSPKTIFASTWQVTAATITVSRMTALLIALGCCLGLLGYLSALYVQEVKRAKAYHGKVTVPEMKAVAPSQERDA